MIVDLSIEVNCNTLCVVFIKQLSIEKGMVWMIPHSKIGDCEGILLITFARKCLQSLHATTNSRQ